MEQMALLLPVDDLLCGKGSESLGIPVHHTESTIDETFVIEVDEHLDDTLRAFLVHREGCPIPVATGTQTAELFQDDAPMLMGPVPGMLKELLTGEIVLLDTLFCKFLHHLGLCGDRGVVSARYPKGVLTLHTGTAHQDVLNRIVEHMAHMEHTGHIGRWDDYRIGFTSVGFAGEEFVVEPVLIPFRFDLFWVVFTCKFHA